MIGLTTKQSEYVRNRGFEIIQREPTVADKFPYIVLSAPRFILEQSEISYKYSPSHWRATRATCHPSRQDQDFLVREIELMVGRDMDLEGELIETTPGRPIKVFIVDDAWNPIAQELVEKYPPMLLPSSTN